MKDIAEVVMNYKQMESISAGGSMLREVRWQYEDMADGGDGGSLGFVPDEWTSIRPPSCREYNYPNTPDSFFQEVRDLMGWK
jgi:hypothetical protein